MCLCRVSVRQLVGIVHIWDLVHSRTEKKNGSFMQRETECVRKENGILVHSWCLCFFVRADGKGKASPEYWISDTTGHRFSNLFVRARMETKGLLDRSACSCILIRSNRQQSSARAMSYCCIERISTARRSTCEKKKERHQLVS